MLATLNLQLLSTDLGGESLPLQAFSPEGGATQVGGFAELLNLRVDTLQQQPVLDGQMLPSDGNKLPLPEPDIAITVNELPVADATADADVLRASRIENIADSEGLPDVNLPEIDLAAADEPVPVVTYTPPAVTPGPVTPKLPALEGTPAKESTSGQVAEHLREASPTPREPARIEISALQVEARVVSSSERQLPILPPGPTADRTQLTPRQVAETMTSDEDISRTLDAAQRQTIAPVATPVIERVAEVMRSRVRPGQPAIAINAQAQPAGFQPLPTTSALSDSSFASTLQQQATDLIRTPVMEPSWGDRIGERVVMLAGNQLKSAEIRLTPAELGPVRVQVSVEEGAANVTFQAAHAVTRDALEQALPRLREMLAENGLTLGQADVADQGVAEGNSDSDAESAEAGIVADDKDGPASDMAPEERRENLVVNGLVDTFA